MRRRKKKNVRVGKVSREGRKRRKYVDGGGKQEAEGRKRMWYCYSVYKCICMLAHKGKIRNEGVRMRERKSWGRKWERGREESTCRIG